MALVLIESDTLVEMAFASFGKGKLELKEPMLLPGIGEVWGLATFTLTDSVKPAGCGCGDETANCCAPDAATTSPAATSCDDGTCCCFDGDDPPEACCD